MGTKVPEKHQTLVRINWWLAYGCLFLAGAQAVRTLFGGDWVNLALAGMFLSMAINRWFAYRFQAYVDSLHHLIKAQHDLILCQRETIDKKNEAITRLTRPVFDSFTSELN